MMMPANNYTSHDVSQTTGDSLSSRLKDIQANFKILLAQVGMGVVDYQFQDLYDALMVKNQELVEEERLEPTQLKELTKSFIIFRDKRVKAAESQKRAEQQRRQANLKRAEKKKSQQKLTKTSKRANR